MRDFDVYFNFYATVVASQDPAEHALNTQDDLLHLIDVLKHQAGSTRAEIRSFFAAGMFRSVESSRIEKSIQMSVRLWLLISLEGENDFLPGQSTLKWSDDETLFEAVSRRFPSARSQTLGRFELSPSLTAYNLIQFGGFPVKWTCNLLDHLALKNDRVHIFHAVSILDALTSGYVQILVFRLFTQSHVQQSASA